MGMTVKQFSLAKIFSCVAVFLLTFQVSPAHAAVGITPDRSQSNAILTGDVDLQFKVDQPRYGSFDFICLSLDGEPIIQSDDLFTFAYVKQPGFGPGHSYDFNYSDKEKPGAGCINEYGFSAASDQYQIELTNFKTGYLVNGQHTLAIKAIYGDGSTIQGELQFISNNSTKLQLEWDPSISAPEFWGTTVPVGGFLGKSSEVPPSKVQVRAIQGGVTSKWSTVATQGGEFFQKNLKITAKTEIQLQFEINGQKRTFSNTIHVKPAIQVSASNLYVLKKSKTTIRVGGLKTGMCQLNVDWGYGLYKTYALPIKNGTAIQYFTFNSMGQYSGEVTCSGKGFVPGTVPFAFQINLG